MRIFRDFVRVMDNIQEHLENPYDEVGADDLRLNVVDSYKPILSQGVTK